MSFILPLLGIRNEKPGDSEGKIILIGRWNDSNDLRPSCDYWSCSLLRHDFCCHTSVTAPESCLGLLLLLLEQPAAVVKVLGPGEEVSQVSNLYLSASSYHPVGYAVDGALATNLLAVADRIFAVARSQIARANDAGRGYVGNNVCWVPVYLGE